MAELPAHSSSAQCEDLKGVCTAGRSPRARSLAHPPPATVCPFCKNALLVEMLNVDFQQISIIKHRFISCSSLVGHEVLRTSYN